jgi:hypothetical protein
MKLASSLYGAAAALCVAAPCAAQALTAVGPYTAVTDRVTYPKPALPALGPAGSAIADPIFASTIRRITDGSTRPGLPNRSYRTPSSPHQNAWSANGSYFYVVSDDGSSIPFAFDATSGTATRLQPASGGAGGLVLNFYVEPQFSFVDDSVIFGSVAGGNLHTVDQYSFSTGAYSRILDLETIVSGLSGTYIGGIASSAGPTERIMVMFGGAEQDYHHLVMVFDKTNPANRLLLDTTANTLNGQGTSIPLNFSLHHVAIDRSGRYLMLYPTSADQTSARQAPQSVAWDSQTGVFTEMPVSTHPYGHDSFGYGVSVNQDCCVTTTYDAMQWQFRNLATPATSRDVLSTVLQPKEVYAEDHSTWNNARSDRLTPFISGIYRYGTQNGAWRALDDEIVAIDSAAAGSSPTIWRFAHHRSDVSYDGDPTRVSFWYEPRPNVSHDGGWVLFTSNWEKTLGTDPAGDPGTAARQDVFLVQLRGTGGGSPAPAPSGSRPMMYVDAPGANAAVAQPFAVSGWAADAAATANSGVDWVDVWAFPNPGSNAAPIYVGGSPANGSRPDIGAYLGVPFTASGFGVVVKGLNPGVYQVNAYAHSRITNTFNDVRSVVVTIVGKPPRMSIDAPGASQAVGRPFMIAGWAFDPNGASGSGIDAIHVWAYPNPGSGAAPVFVGTAAFGSARPDVAAAFGPAGASSGFGMIATLPSGTYDVVVFAHSTATGTFNQAQAVRVTVR